MHIPSSMAEPIAPLAAALAGRYAIEGIVGRGGMATVYQALDQKHGRQVAIKVLRPDLTAAFGSERFLREIGIAARLAHPHIVPLIDSGETEGLLYYVSQYVPGGSLRDRLDREPRLSLKDAIQIVREAGAGLDYAHRNGFVHRDVKPENILFADGHAVLADFGIARAFANPGGGPVVTEVGLALGTPEYMSPEQASGDQNLGSESDVYSLGCVLYEMLAGQPPFSEPTPRATMAKHITQQAPPVRARRPEVPPTVDRALQRALAKDPDERFPSVVDFIAALDATGTDDHRPLPGATRSIAVLPFVNASPDPENEYLSDGITDELIDALAKVEHLRVASRTSVFALKGKPQDVRAIGALLGATVLLEGTVRRAGDRLRITAQLSSTEDGRLLWSQRFDRRLDDVFAIQEEISRTIVDTLRASVAGLSAPRRKRATENVKAYGLYLKGRYAWNKRTQEGVAEGIQYFEQAIAEDPRFALAYTGLSDSYALQIDYRSVPVAEGMERARTAARRALELDETLAEAHASLAWCLFIYDWEWDAAEREFRRAIELDPRYASARQWHAFLLVTRGRLDEAMAESLRALELDGTSVSVRRSVGWAHYYARRHDQARYHMLRAMTMNPMAAESYRILALIYEQQGNLQEAERVAREATELPAGDTYTQATLGFVLGRAGKTAEARAVLETLEHQARTGYVSPVAFATVYLGLGDMDRALDWMERAFEDRRGWLAYLKVNPILDPVQQLPRFQALVKKMRL
jgi:eukaryotic-like serine/threonine-protein kinase